VKKSTLNHTESAEATAPAGASQPTATAAQTATAEETAVAAPKRAFLTFGRLVAGLSALLLLIVVLCLGKSLVNRVRLSDSFGKLSRACPTLVVERVRFSKYLARGTLPRNDPHFAFLDVFLIRGTADVQYDLSRFVVDRRTNYLSRTLVLRYTGDEKFLVDVDVFIDPDDVSLAESIDQAPFSDSEREGVKRFLAVPLASAGALIGGTAGAKAGGVLGSASFLKYSGGFKSLIGSAVGASVGGLAGAAAGTGTAYLFTDNLLTALQSSGNGVAPIMEMCAAAKPLIALELVSGDALSGADWEAAVAERYRREFLSRITAIAKNFGWKRVVVDFGGAR
jgi:hypothetical protein